MGGRGLMDGGVYKLQAESRKLRFSVFISERSSSSAGGRENPQRTKNGQRHHKTAETLGQLHFFKFCMGTRKKDANDPLRNTEFHNWILLTIIYT